MIEVTQVLSLCFGIVTCLLVRIFAISCWNFCYFLIILYCWANFRLHIVCGMCIIAISRGLRYKFLEILMCYLTFENLQIRPGSSSVSSGSPDRIQLSRTEIWTKDVTDFLQCLLDELFSRNNSHSIPQNRERTQHMLYSGSVQQKSDPASLALDSEEPSLHFKWWYGVRILHWHHAEGLILSSQVIDWVFLQFQVLIFFKKQ